LKLCLIYLGYQYINGDATRAAPVRSTAMKKVTQKAWQAVNKWSPRCELKRIALKFKCQQKFNNSFKDAKAIADLKACN
jgi:phage baseplate assembly protein W